LHVYVDTREPKHIIKFLKQTFPEYEFELMALPEGDYCSKSVLVERKTINDLYTSIVGSRGKPGRLANQALRLSCHDDKVVLIMVIGNVFVFINEMKRLKINVDASIIYGMLASLSCREGIHVMWFEKEYDALITMVKFMQKVDEGNYMIPSKRDSDILLSKYFRVTVSQWREIKNKFGSLSEMMEATEKDFMSIKG